MRISTLLFMCFFISKFGFAQKIMMRSKLFDKLPPPMVKVKGSDNVEQWVLPEEDPDTPQFTTTSTTDQSKTSTSSNPSIRSSTAAVSPAIKSSNSDPSIQSSTTAASPAIQSLNPDPSIQSSSEEITLSLSEEPIKISESLTKKASSSIRKQVIVPKIMIYE